MTEATEAARAAAISRFRWIDGHADVWRLAEDAETFATVVRGLADLAAQFEPDAIAGIETRGVLFGAPTAYALGLGFHTLRKGDGLFAGASVAVEAEPDYRDRRHTLRSRRAFRPGARVVLIDDWIERGSQARAARSLIEGAGAEFAGGVVVVDQSDGTFPVAALATAADLPPSDGSSSRTGTAKAGPP